MPTTRVGTTTSRGRRSRRSLPGRTGTTSVRCPSPTAPAASVAIRSPTPGREPVARPRARAAAVAIETQRRCARFHTRGPWDGRDELRILEGVQGAPDDRARRCQCAVARGMDNRESRGQGPYRRCYKVLRTAHQAARGDRLHTAGREVSRDERDLRGVRAPVSGRLTPVDPPARLSLPPESR